MKKINIWDLIKLIILSNIFMIFLDIFGNALLLIMVYFKIGVFIFNWDDFLYGSLDKALAGGIVLGIGLWLKYKLKERQEQKDQGRSID